MRSDALETAPPPVFPFNEAVADLLTKVRYRPAHSPEELEAIYRLRYRSYLREGATAPRPQRMIYDAYDDTFNARIFGCYIDGALVSTLRLHAALRPNDPLPAAAVFPDLVTPLLEGGKRILDPTRFVIDEQAAKSYPKLAYVTLRLAWLATEHHDVDLTLATVRPEHQAFYRRFYGHQLVSDPRPYPELIKPLSLMILEFKPSRARGLLRYPFLASTREERVALFDDVQTRRERSGIGSLRPASVSV